MRHVLSSQGSIGAKRGVKLKDAESVTHAKRGPRAKRAIQQKHTLSLQLALSARSERAKRAYEDPKPTSAAINREPVQGEKHISPQSTYLSILGLSSPFSLYILCLYYPHSFFHP